MSVGEDEFVVFVLSAKSTLNMLEKDVKLFKVNNKDTRITS